MYMIKRLLLLTIVVFFYHLPNVYSQITIGTVDPGPYGTGSNITVPINFTDNQSEFNIGNTFTLYISDAAGNFIGNGTAIGTFSGFYTPFINGTIPNGFPASSNYKLQIKSSNPATTISVPGTVEIRNVAASPVTLTPNLASTNLGGDNFGWCPANAGNGKSISLTSNAVVPTVVKVTLKNLITGATTDYAEIPGLGFDITGIDLGYYSLTATATTIIGGVPIQSIKTYFLHNTQLTVNIQDIGKNIGCFSTSGAGAAVEYQITLINGINNNYPGSTYLVSWGDGTPPQTLTIKQIADNASRISHSYTKNSCNEPNIPGPPVITHSFKATITATNPICGTSNSATAYAQVFQNPTAVITPATSIGCINNVIRFTNASTGGTRSDCSTQMDYTWYVDGVKRRETSSNAPFDWTFTTVGPHTVKLVASNGVGSCPPSEFTANICIQEPPKPDFDFNGATTTHCAPFSITANDKSILDNTCGDNHVYTWIVIKSGRNALPSEVTFTNNVRQPTFNFLKQGKYEITLQIKNTSCAAVSTQPPQTVIIIDSAPTTTLAPVANLCRLGIYNYDNVTADPTNVQFFGTEVDAPDTYTWSVTAADGTPLTSADFSFEEGTGVNTKYPHIQFKQYITYKVTVVHKNSCGSIPKEQLITFLKSPEPTITAIPNPICYDGVINLQGAIDNSTTNTRFQWIGAPGGVFSDPLSLTTTYTPTLAERNAGTSHIRLMVTTGLAGACAQVPADIDVTILANNISTNPIATRTQNICTGNAAVFNPTSATVGTTFTWTVQNADGNATLPSTSGSGNINQVLINNSQTQNAIVVYTITPATTQCTGVPFTFTVTVYPKPAVTAVAAKATICSGEQAGITLTPSTPGIQYTWISTVTGSVTGNVDRTVATSIPTINDVLINTGTAQGTVTYNITPTSTIGGCTGDVFSITINVDPAVTTATAGTSVSICDALTYTLDGNLPKTNEIGTWSVTSGQAGVTFLPTDHAINATATGLVAGEIYTFRWTITAPGVCNPSSADVTITVNPPTVAGTLTADKTTVCYGTNSGQITLAGQLGSVIRWESSIDNGVTWVTISNTTTTLAFTNLTTNTQYRAVVANGSCTEKTTDPVIITVNPAITIATAGPDQNLCDEKVITLAGNAADLNKGETGKWIMTQGDPNAQITDPTDPTTTVTALAPGIYKFQWTITGAPICDPTFDEVTINNLPPIVNTIGNPVTKVCYGQTINITNTVLSGGDNTYTYLWESSTDGTNWAVIPNQTGQDLTFQLLETLSFRRTVKSGACSSVSNIITVIALPPIARNTITATQTICAGLRPLKLEGSDPTGGDGSNYTFKWQFSIDNGTTWTDISGTNFKDFEPPILEVTTLYRRIVSTVECSGALQNESTPVTIKVNPNAKAVFTFTTDKGCIPFVINAQNVKATPFPEGNATYTWYANDVEIGTGITFPEYTISNSNEQVIIKLVTTSLNGCKDDFMEHTFSTNQNVDATFTQSATGGCGPLLVNFVNTSTSLTNATFKWDFGNGSTSTQTMPAPVTFLADPSGADITYTVTLTATTTCGESVTTSTVFVKAKAKAVFSPDKVTGCSPMKVIFSNTSPGATNTYHFDFGDGSPIYTTTDRTSVEHTYNTITTQDFTVTMVAENDCGTDQQSFVIRVAPNTITPELVVNANEKEGCAPFTVNFYNNSKGANLFKYDFGDGGTLLTRTAPEVVQHTFTKPGTYTVVLTASNGCSVVTTEETITVLEQPVTNFSADVTIGCPGMLVKFINNSSGAVTYLWDFGDGTTSNEFAPSHVYSGTAPFYTVTLTTTNSLGCTHSLAQTNFINIVQPPIAQFSVKPGIQISIPNYTFNFVDESTNTPDQWTWDFGDGTGSSLKSPNHTYLDTGLYKVNLRVTNQQGCYTETHKFVRIIGVPGYLFVPNSFIPGSETNELRQFIAKGSGIKSWRFSIFDKWGEMMWETTKLDEGRPVEGWDGTFKGVPMPQGVYYWKIDVQMINGSEWKGMTYGTSAPKRTGAIHLIR